MLESISAYTAGCSNVQPPILLDVTVTPWPVQGLFDSVHATNITHIAPWTVTQSLLAGVQIIAHTAHVFVLFVHARQYTGAASCLRPGGLLFLYGPFSVDGQPHTPGNMRFHQQLVATDPALGYRDVDAVAKEATAVGLSLQERIAMPADNFMLLFSNTDGKI